MKLYAKTDDYAIYEGNMLDMLEEIEPNSIDSIVTDPPYGLTSITKRFGKEGSAPAQFGKDGAFSRLSKGFMGKEWDGSGIEYNVDAWKKCLEVLKPGGYLLAFGGTRTYHRIACAIEDAGFEIRDCLMFLYGTGFPKSMSISKAIEAKEKYGKTNTVAKRMIEQSSDGKEYKIKQTNNGAMGEVRETTRKEWTPQSELAQRWKAYGTCLKPAYEPIILARKPFKGSLVDNVLKYGVGGINIDECRVGNEHFHQKAGQAKSLGRFGDKVWDEKEYDGRFPANVIHDGSEEATAGMPKSKGGSGKAFKKDDYGYNETATNFQRGDFIPYNDDGSASRYFYSAKASKRDREEGLDELEAKDGGVGALRDGNRNNTMPRRNTHPTVKPTALMQYLIRLVTPRGGGDTRPIYGEWFYWKGCYV